jgi:hypothetical protein
VSVEACAADKAFLDEDIRDESFSDAPRLGADFRADPVTGQEKKGLLHRVNSAACHAGAAAGAHALGTIGSGLNMLG